MAASQTCEFLTTSFIFGKWLSENETRNHHVCLFALRIMLLKDIILSSSFSFLVCQKGCLFCLQQQGHFLVNCNMKMKFLQFYTIIEEDIFGEVNISDLK